MKKYLSRSHSLSLLLSLLLLFACADHDTRTFDKSTAMKKVELLCLASSAPLTWLSDLLDSAQTGEWKGNVYAFRYSSGVAIVHQPMIMSCLGCRVYGCGGLSITLTSDLQQEITSNMNDKNIILKPL